jgi:small-conductance mechanosensitive channel
MEFVIDSLRADWEAFLAFLPRLFYALILLLVALVVARIVGNLLSRLIRRSARFHPNERFIRTIAATVIVSAGTLLALGVMGFTGVAASLLATGGVVAIVLGFAFREIGENFLAGVFLTFSRPFELGDLIMTGELTGTVRAIHIRSIHIRTADACDVFVPSAQIFREALYNYTRDGLRRPTFTIGVAYDHEPEAVLALLERTAAAVDDVLADPEPFVTIAEFSGGWVVYEVFFYMDVNASGRGLVAVTNDVKASCWRALREAGMTFSTDVTTAIDIRSAPPVELHGGKS